MTKEEFKKLAKKHLFVSCSEYFKGEDVYEVYGIDKLYEALSIPVVKQQRELLYVVCDKLTKAIHKHPLPPSLKSAVINDVLADNCD